MKLPDDFISLCICLPLAAEPGVLLGSIGTVCKFQQNTKPYPFFMVVTEYTLYSTYFLKSNFFILLSLRPCPLRNKRIVHKCNNLIFLIHNLTVVFVSGMNGIMT